MASRAVVIAGEGSLAPAGIMVVGKSSLSHSIISKCPLAGIKGLLGGLCPTNRRNLEIVLIARRFCGIEETAMKIFSYSQSQVNTKLLSSTYHHPPFCCSFVLFFYEC